MSGERIVPEKISFLSEYYLLLKEKFCYEAAAAMITSGQACLDLGCGAGFGVPILKKNSASVVGLDIDSQALETAKKNYSLPGCSFFSYEGRTLPLGSGQFDWVVCLQVLEHVNEPEKFIAEIKRVLVPGGSLVLSTPNRLTRLEKGMSPWNVFHLKEYSSQELECLLKKYFSQIKMFGLAASQQIQEFEEKRILVNKKIARLDFLNLRRQLPLNFSVKILQFLGQFRRAAKLTPDNFNNSSLSEKYFLKPDNFDKAFDLLAVCRL